jgi:hypothetical protein
VVCPKQALIWRKDITAARSRFPVRTLEVFYPVEFPLRAEIVTNPDSAMAEALDGREYLVMKQIGEVALWRRYDLLRLDQRFDFVRILGLKAQLSALASSYEVRRRGLRWTGALP